MFQMKYFKMRIATFKYLQFTTELVSEILNRVSKG